jgi:hypothetical protein
MRKQHDPKSRSLIGAKPSSWWRKLLADEGGAATTETVIMIPMYAIVWGCIVYVTVHFQNTIEMRMRIRRDTWAYAYTACQDEPDTGTNLDPSSGIWPDDSGTTDGGSSASGSGALAGIDNILSYVPGLTFTTIRGNRADFHTPRPDVIGGGQLTLAADLTILCNEQPKGVLEMIVDIFKSAFGF